MNYIIQQEVKIGNPENKIIDVLTKDQINNYLEKGYRLKERMYKLTVRHNQYTVVCWEIWKENDSEHSLILPEFFIPHRTYAVYVYAYAIALYSTQPEKSQRAVAEETRKKFNLQTFAHTTVGRAMKQLAQILTITESADDKTAVNIKTKEPNRMRKANKDSAKRFSVLSTKQQRELIKSLFSNRPNTPVKVKLKRACDHIVAYWHMNFHHLFSIYLHQISGVNW